MKHLIALFMAFALIVPAHAETRVPQSAAEISLGFAPLVKEAAPAVVNIYAKRVTQARRTPFFDDPFFQRFFEGFGDVQPRVQNSLGSGVILSRDGFVVSNYHVVGMATDVRVVLNDRREFKAEVLLGDEESDLAILRLEGAQDLPHLELRDSDTVEVGELVLAIGNPFGVGQTVSSGIVSGLARSGGTNGGGRGYFIQTDAPINPGNSGGALIDVAGRLIGINTRILTRSGGSNGIGFAIPANLVQAFVRQAEAGNDDFVRPWAGLTGQAVDSDIAEMLGLDRPGGIILSAIHPLSPFADDFEVGDAILSAGGVPVNTPQEMMYHMAVAGEGGTLRVKRLRDGRTLGLTVRLIAAPEDPPRDTIVLGNRTVLPGLTVSRINPALTAEMRLPMASEGVVVEDTGPYASRIGLRAGDILIEVAGRQIERPRDVRAALSQDARRYTITALRGQRRIYLRF